MGIDFAFRKKEFPKNSPHWSYSGFNVFRKRLAKDIGIELDAMDGHGGSIAWDTVEDDIVPLLNHSNCDGELSYDQCEKVAPRLRELIKGWPEDDYDKRTALKLCDMMDECAKNDWILEFT